MSASIAKPPTDNALTLLQQALEQASYEEPEDAQQLTTNGFQWFGEFNEQHSEEEVSKGSDSPSSSDDSAESSGDEPETDIAVPQTPEPSSQESSAKPRVPRPPRKRDKHQKQFEQKLKQCIQNVQRLSLNLPDKERCIKPPSSLAPRDVLRSTSKRQACQYLCDLSQALVSDEKPLTIVLLLRSGRFAAAVFHGEKCLDHTTSTRYTIRKGQGKAQSAQDGNRRPKSMGSQLRRAGEQSLKEDVQATILRWKDHFARASLVLLSCPKVMKSVVFSPAVDSFFPKSDPRVSSVPLDMGRPSFDTVRMAYQVMMMIQVQEVQATKAACEPAKESKPNTQAAAPNIESQSPDEPKEPVVIAPLDSLHKASKEGDLEAVLDILRSPEEINVDQLGGYDLMSPLHFAAESTENNVEPDVAAAIVSALLLQGQADPTVLDARNRVPYFLAVHDKTREAFRKARAFLEDAWDWDLAKVGPALTEDDIKLKKEKEAEKKRRKKANQKKKRDMEKARAAAVEEKLKEEEEKEARIEAARRERAGLAPKTGGANSCDFCQTECKGRKRQQMFHRLDFKYCSNDCLQKHKRELMASAAMARFGQS
eukprot:Nitzschia sp. Nitz4//scaffold4_size323378//138197//140005//NITZ4_000656-RA/size323378-snap-gene-0.417-mRNA-1//1//CDS//3329553387//1193//frame0